MALGGFSVAHAATINYAQTDNSVVAASLNSSSGNSFFGIQSTNSFDLSAINLWMEGTTTQSYIVLVDCYTDMTASTRCPSWTLANTGPYRGMVLKGTTTAAVGGAAVTFAETLASTTAPYSAGQVLQFRVFPYSGAGGRIIYGSTVADDCDTNCVVGTTPWLIIYGDDGVAPIDWGAYRFDFTYATTSFGIATSSGLWGAYTASSTLDEIGESCAGDNVLGKAICTSFAYMFVPNPEVVGLWTNLPTTAQTKFPFSWVTDVKNSITGLTASSTANSPTYAYNLADLGLGSTTPLGNMLPNFTAFSSSTALTYMPAGVWAAGQALMAAVLWLALGFDIYATVRRRHAHV